MTLTGTRDVSAPHVAGRRRVRSRPEIDGLLGLAVALAVAHHFAPEYVTGGVDALFVLSGFLLTLSLTRELQRRGTVSLAGFYSRAARRVLPPSALVLVGSLLAALLWIPQSRWSETLTQAFASAFYYENWYLADAYVSFPAWDASPVQHYWAIAVLGQVILLWPLLLLGVIRLARSLSIGAWRAAIAACALVFVSSLTYSVYGTLTDPVYAHFDTFARLWQFALGGLIGLVLPHVKLDHALRVLLGWIGMIALLASGLVFEATPHAGYLALWPTLAVGLMILGADGESRFGTDRFLGSAPMRGLGRMSYALYLWHWPILVCYLASSGQSAPGWLDTVAVVALSLLLAWLTRQLFEGRARSLGSRGRLTSTGLAVGALFMVVAVAVTMGAAGYRGSVHGGDPLDSRRYPGAAYLAEGASLPDAPYRPLAQEAKTDRPRLYDHGCRQDFKHADVITCTYGPPLPELTVALVGNSHAAHWSPALRRIAEDRGWNIVTMIKSSCPLDTRHAVHDRDPDNTCRTWNGNVLSELDKLGPDLVFTVGTTGNQRITDNVDATPDGYIDQWQALDDLGLPVVAVRDTPWHDGDVPECVPASGPDAPACGGERSKYALDSPAQVLSMPDVPDNVTLIDMTDYVCAPDRCPAVVGNVLVYRDAHHLTTAYAHTLAPYLFHEMKHSVPRLGQTR